MFFGNCRHAWVRYAQAPPESCKIYPSSRECKKALELRNSITEQKGQVHKVQQTYYLMGFYPAARVLDTANYCPEGPKVVHQYTSFSDGLYEQLSLGIYSPQTLEVECYP
ncbi:hypothetical protein CH373_03100 [Leptospira perolatii]|uniref:Uncharacterized protein n=2 Tax=Leptospira perolatii TaxID=2023191 RepID=A0A2M9ZT35_9LEPT|nr:hypothetical protein [Leptospira perolatii]PJZ71610.1 hypothetical protein CH360_03095 [Leptospira perolatii]PJZ75226.1 hypothetical protein CH373_03100 [Leptospira perolatii]